MSLLRENLSSGFLTRSDRNRAVRRRSQCSKIFSKAAWPIKAKFYVEPPWVGGTKVCSGHLCHITKMAATPIYGKNPSKISRTGRPIFTKLGFSQKLLCQSEPNFVWKGRGNESLFTASGSHDQDGATPINVKKPSKSSSPEPTGPISTKLSMLHWGLQPIMVCSNDDPGVTLTYCTVRSNLVILPLL